MSKPMEVEKKEQSKEDKMIKTWNQIKSHIKKDFKRTSKDIKKIIDSLKIQIERGLLLKILYVLITMLIVTVILKIILCQPFLRWANGVLVGDEINQPRDLSSVFLSLSMALVGVVAIVFSIVLIPIQKASDQYSPLILERFRNDKVNRLIFALNFVFILVLFSFSFIPPKPNIIVWQTLTAILIIASLPFILRWQYDHNINLMNPNRMLLDQQSRIAKFLLKYYKQAHKFSDEIAEQTSIDKMRAMASFFYQTNYSRLLNQAKSELEETFDIIRSNFKRGKYGITQTGLATVVNIFKSYASIKNKNTFSSPAFMPDDDIASDDFLNYILEKLNDINSLVQTEKDFEISRQVTSCLYQMALFATVIEYLDNRLRENRVCNLILGYYERCLNSAMKNGYTDISIKASDELGKVGIALVRNGYSSYLGISTILTIIKNLALRGANSPKEFYITSWPLRAYMNLLRALIWKNTFDLQTTSKSIFIEIGTIFGVYFALNRIPNRYDESAVLAFYSILDQASYAKAFTDLLQELNSETLSSERKKQIISALLTATKEFADFTFGLTRNEDIPKERIATQVSLNIFEIFEYLCHLHNFVETDEAHKEEIIEILRNLLYTFDFLLNSKNERFQLEHTYLMDMAYGLKKSNIPELISHIINILIGHGWKLEKLRYNFHTLEKAIILAVFSRDKRSTDRLIKLFEDEIFPTLVGDKYRGQEVDRFMFDLNSIDPTGSQFRRSSSDMDETIVSEIEMATLTYFKSRLESVHHKAIAMCIIVKNQRNRIFRTDG